MDKKEIRISIPADVQEILESAVGSKFDEVIFVFPNEEDVSSSYIEARCSFRRVVAMPVETLPIVQSQESVLQTVQR